MDSAGLLHVTMIDSTNMVKTWHTATWVEGSWSRKGRGGGWGVCSGVYIYSWVCVPMCLVICLVH